jgi:hypothetical protein
VVANLAPVVLIDKLSGQAGERNVHIGTRLPQTRSQNINYVAFFIYIFLIYSCLGLLVVPFDGEFECKRF